MAAVPRKYNATAVPTEYSKGWLKSELLAIQAAIPSADAPITWAMLPTGTGTWDAGVGAIMTFARALVLSLGLTVSANGITVNAGGLTVNAGTTAVQALTATTGVFSGDVSMNNLTANGDTHTFGLGTLSANVAVSIRSAAGFQRQLTFRTAGNPRWAIRVPNTAEPGADAGADLNVVAFTDAGAQIDVPIAVTRASGGSITFVRPLTSRTITWGTSGSELLGVDAFHVELRSRRSGLAGAGFFDGTEATATNSKLYITGSSGAEPFNAIGNLVIQTRTDAGFQRSIYFVTGNPAAWRWRITGASGHFVPGADATYDIGTTTGRVANVLVSASVQVGATIATAGVVRLENASSINWRNAANTGNHFLNFNASDQFVFSTAVVVSAGGLTVTAGGLTVSAGTTAVQALTATTGAFTGDVVVTSTGANALTVGRQGATNPVLQIDASTATVVTGLKVKGAAAAAGLALSVISSGTDESLTIDAKGTGTITLAATSTGNIILTRATTLSNGGTVTTGGFTVSAGTTAVQALTATTGAFSSTVTVTSASASALAVGRQGATAPALQVDASTASSATGLKITAKAAASGLALAVISSGTNENLTVDALGTGTITVGGTSTGNIILSRAATAVSIAATAAITSSGATSGIGYATGAGGAQTQLTSKSTGVTLNTICGEITMNGAALAAATIVSFTLTNSAIAAKDTIILNHVTTGTRGAYTLNGECLAGSATISVRNNTAGSLSEAIVIRFAVIKAVTS